MIDSWEMSTYIAHEYLNGTDENWARYQWNNLDHMSKAQQTRNHDKVGTMCIYLSLITAWVCNHMPSKVWDVITYPFLNFNGGTIKVKEWINTFIPHFIMDVITYRYWD